MENAIQVGDVVVLKSGSPKMTVDTLDDNYGTPTVWCSWYDGKKIVNDDFPLSSVKKYDSD